jgi:hypothetical protein
VKVKVLFTQNYPKLITINCRSIDYSKSRDYYNFEGIDAESKAVLAELNETGKGYVEFTYSRDGDNAATQASRIQHIRVEDK